MKQKTSVKSILRENNTVGSELPLINLASNENPLGCSPLVSNLLTSIVELNRYPTIDAFDIKMSISKYYDIYPETILVGNGSDELISFITSGFLDNGHNIIMSDPSFFIYEVRSRLMGADVIKIKLTNNNKHNLSSIIENIDNSTRIIFICNPNNPTGTMNDISEIIKFIDECKRMDLIIVLDEAYIEFTEISHNLLSKVSSDYKNLIILRTFSKAYGLAGLRVGYAIAHPDIITYLRSFKPVFNVNSIAQKIAAIALSDQEFIASSKKYVSSCRNFFEKKLYEMNTEFIKSIANFITFYVGDDVSTTIFLRNSGFLVCPLKQWGLPGFIRVSFSNREEDHINLFEILYKQIIVSGIS